jgi:hypothetical protein
MTTSTDATTQTNYLELVRYAARSADVAARSSGLSDSPTSGLLLLAVVLLGCLGAVGCTGDGADRRASSQVGRDYVVLRDPAWRLQEAIRPRAEDLIAQLERPPMTWYAEYVRSPTPTESQMVRVSGHRAGAARARAELEAVGFSFAPVPVASWDAVGGNAPDDPSSPSMLVLDNGRSSVLVLSHELDLDELADVA